MADHDHSLREPILRGLAAAARAAARASCSTGFLKVAPRCEHCGLDFSFADSADGPAFFVMSFSGFLVVFPALAVEVLFQPPYWLHALLWLPLILDHHHLPLRPVKGVLIALQYHHQAEEGRLVRGDTP